MRNRASTTVRFLGFAVAGLFFTPPAWAIQVAPPTARQIPQTMTYGGYPLNYGYNSGSFGNSLYGGSPFNDPRLAYAYYGFSQGYAPSLSSYFLQQAFFSDEQPSLPLTDLFSGSGTFSQRLWSIFGEGFLKPVLKRTAYYFLSDRIRGSKLDLYSAFFMNPNSSLQRAAQRQQQRLTSNPLGCTDCDPSNMSQANLQSLAQIFQYAQLQQLLNRVGSTGLDYHYR